MLIQRSRPKMPAPDPSTFAGIMELYEKNYIYIRKLCGNLHVLPDQTIAHIDNGYALVMLVTERSPYTLSLKFYYPAGYCNGEIHLPAFFVRVYFDARQAESMCLTNGMRRIKNHGISHHVGSSVAQRWSDNRLLFKWLAYWEQMGYSFKEALTKN